MSVGSMQKVRILEWRMRGLPFVLEAFRRRFSWVSRDAVVVKKCPGSLETLIVMNDRQESSRTPFYVSERHMGKIVSLSIVSLLHEMKFEWHCNE